MSSCEAKEFHLRLVGHIPLSAGTWAVLHSNQELIVHAEEFLYNPPVSFMMGDRAGPVIPDYSVIDRLADSVAFYDWLSTICVFYHV